jgi:transcriptional regulator with XRE-family HTH domain
MLEKFLDLIKDENDGYPNKFAAEMGKRIRNARLEAKMSQTELAERAYFRQASISDIEAGKRSVSASQVTYLSIALNKPILYFYPLELLGINKEKELSMLEQELIMQVRRLSQDDLKKLIAQTRAVAEM